jgi:hypothetical protein
MMIQIVPCRDRSSLKRFPFTGPRPTIRSIFIFSSRPSVTPSTGQQLDVTRFNCNGSSQIQALGYNDDDSQTRPDSTCQLARPWLHETHSLGQRSWQDSRHRTSAQPRPSTIIPHHHTLPTIAPCRLLCVARLSTNTYHLADDGLLAIFTWSLRRATATRPEALIGSHPRGKRSFRSLTLLRYLVAIVGICPRIDNIRRSWIHAFEKRKTRG